MDQGEFKEFRKQLKGYLPGLSDQVKSRPQEEINTLLKVWWAAFGQCELRDCLVVLEKMATGELSRPFLDDFPGFMRIQAGTVRRRRRTAEMVPQATDVDRRRYNCFVCWDTGFVTVVSSKVIGQLRDEVPVAEVEYEHREVARCSCGLGATRPSNTKPKDEIRGKRIPVIGGLLVPWTGNREEDCEAVLTALKMAPASQVEMF